MAEQKGSPQFHVSKGNTGNVVKVAGEGNFASKFIETEATFEKSLGRAVFRDEAQKNAVIIYKSHLEIFDMQAEIIDLVNWLNGTCAIGGFNRSLAAMVGTDTYLPEGAGIKVGKQTVKAFAEMHDRRAKKDDGDD